MLLSTRIPRSCFKEFWKVRGCCEGGRGIDCVFFFFESLHAMQKALESLMHQQRRRKSKKNKHMVLERPRFHIETSNAGKKKKQRQFFAKFHDIKVSRDRTYDTSI